VPRFLHQRSTPARLLAVLIFCTVLPALVLAGYGIKGLLEADTVHNAALRTQREHSATSLRHTLHSHAELLLESLDATTATICKEEQWLQNAEACGRALLAHSNRLSGLLLVSPEGEVLFPPAEEDAEPSPRLRALKLLMGSDTEPGGTGFVLRELRSDTLSVVAGAGRIGPLRILVSLNLESLRGEWRPMVSAFNRSNPTLRARIVGADYIADEAAPATRWQASLSPWLPEQWLSVASVPLALNGPSTGHRMWLQIAVIIALVLIIAAAVKVAIDTLSHEVRLARMKSDFVSNVSHELRTPLTTIRIMAEMLALGAVSGGEKQAEYHRNIVSEAERLTRLINNVLDFARIEEGRKKFDFGMGDVGDVVFEVVRIVGDYARKEGFEITTSVADDLPATSFDRDAVIQALINLTANAVKYSEEDKRIEVGARNERDSIVLWVADHGPGVDPQELPHLFEKFYRGGEHLTREIGGTGLGLAIVQHIVHAHGGKVSARSTPGEGSTFEILLPVRQEEQAMSAEGRR